MVNFNTYRPTTVELWLATSAITPRKVERTAQTRWTDDNDLRRKPILIDRTPEEELEDPERWDGMA